MLGITHHELTEEMSYQEYLGWNDYFRVQPDGWREDLRAFYIMNASGNMKKGSKPEDYFPSIKQLKKAEQDKKDKLSAENAVDTSSLKASPFAAMLGHVKGF